MPLFAIKRLCKYETQGLKNPIFLHCGVAAFTLVSEHYFLLSTVLLN